MDATHLHLILTHFPIVGTIIGSGILAYGQISKNDDIKKVALATFVLMSLITIPVFLSGEAAEDTVENIIGVSEEVIENHEELAEKAIWVMGLLGTISVFTFFAIIKKLPFSKTISVITLIVSLGTFGLFAIVGSTGGEIRHSEIRTNNVNNDAEIFNHRDSEEHDDNHD